MLKGFEYVGMTGGNGPRQNRVGPTGEIVADPGRGMFMGNRGGVLHVDSRRLGVSRWKNRTWIACRLDFKGRRRSVMSPGRYTELFFLDEAVSFAAGNRPCAECRRGSYNAFAACWSVNGPRPGAGAMDSVLHAARVDARTRTQVTSVAAIESLPDGAFIRLPGDPTPWLVRGDALRPFAFAGYGPPRPRPGSGEVEVLTPAPTLAVLRAGYPTVFHLSASV